MQRFRNSIREARQAGIAALSRFNINVKKKAATKVRGCISMSCVSETSPERKAICRVTASRMTAATRSGHPCKRSVNFRSPLVLPTRTNMRQTLYELQSRYGRLRNCVRVIPIILRAGNNKRKRITAPVDFNHSPTVPSLKPFVPNTACH